MFDYSKILVTTDFSDQAMPAVHRAGHLARQFGSELIVLYVVRDDLPPILGTLTGEGREEILERHRGQAEQALNDYVETHLPGCRSTKVTAIGTPENVIVEQAKEHGVGMIIIASRGYGPLRQLLLGSVTERVLHHSPCPVLVVPSKDF